MATKPLRKKDGCERERGKGDCKKGALWDLRGNQKKKWRGNERGVIGGIKERMNRE